jgi:hypothetical protein
MAAPPRPRRAGPILSPARWSSRAAPPQCRMLSRGERGGVPRRASEELAAACRARPSPPLSCMQRRARPELPNVGHLELVVSPSSSSLSCRRALHQSSACKDGGAGWPCLQWRRPRCNEDWDRGRTASSPAAPAMEEGRTGHSRIRRRQGGSRGHPAAPPSPIPPALHPPGRPPGLAPPRAGEGRVCPPASPPPVAERRPDCRKEAGSFAPLPHRRARSFAPPLGAQAAPPVQGRGREREGRRRRMRALVSSPRASAPLRFNRSVRRRRREREGRWEKGAVGGKG